MKSEMVNILMISIGIASLFQPQVVWVFRVEITAWANKKGRPK
jgi:hypothetical protein